jgi:hypothetical protein
MMQYAKVAHAAPSRIDDLPRCRSWICANGSRTRPRRRSSEALSNGRDRRNYQLYNINVACFARALSNVPFATAISSFLIFILQKIRFKNDYFEANSTGQDRLGSGQAYPEAVSLQERIMNASCASGRSAAQHSRSVIGSLPGCPATEEFHNL